MPEGVSNAANNRCCATEACMEALSIATTKKKVKEAFEKSGICVSEGDEPIITIDPWRLAEALPNSDHAFEEPLLNPPRSALYSCQLNTERLIELITLAKNEDLTKEETAEAWKAVAVYRDNLTDLENRWYFENEGKLPWHGNPLVGKKVQMAYEAGRKPRKSIAPKSPKHWSEVMAEEKKKKICFKKR